MRFKDFILNESKEFFEEEIFEIFLDGKLKETYDLKDWKNLYKKFKLDVKLKDDEILFKFHTPKSTINFSRKIGKGWKLNGNHFKYGDKIDNETLPEYIESDLNQYYFQKDLKRIFTKKFDHSRFELNLNSRGKRAISLDEFEFLDDDFDNGERELFFIDEI